MSKEVLVEDDAIIEKYVGDEVVALFIPLMTGPEHAKVAVRAAEACSWRPATGPRRGPGAARRGRAHRAGVRWGGGLGASTDFTALGDPVNIAAHLASQAAIGEVLVTTESATAAQLSLDGLERRHVSLKGHPVDAVVVRAHEHAEGEPVTGAR